MSLVGDMVLQSANAPGTGPFNLIAPPAGRSSFVSQNGVGQVYYFAEDPSGWEKGIGTVSSGSPDTLSRDTIIGNSLGTTARINFAGEVMIFCDIPAERTMWADQTGQYWLGQNRILAGIGRGTYPDHAVRLDQLATVRAFSTYQTSGVFVLPVPPMIAGDVAQLVEIDLMGVTLAADTSLYLRISTDNGASYMSGSGDYYGSVSVLSSTSIVGGGSGAGSYAGLTGVLSASAGITGKIRYTLGAYSNYDSSIAGVLSGGGYCRSLAQGNGSSGAPTHIIIGAVAVSLTGGVARISRVGF